MIVANVINICYHMNIINTKNLWHNYFCDSPISEMSKKLPAFVCVFMDNQGPTINKAMIIMKGHDKMNQFRKVAFLDGIQM